MTRSAQRTTGRPRDRRVDEAITAATRELLAEAGYAGLTVAAVAARAGVGKAAIYRRYATKQEMVFEAAFHSADLAAPADTGSLLGDLTALAEEIVDEFGDPAGSRAVVGMLAEVLDDPAFAEGAGRRFAEAQRRVVTELLTRAVGRGELERRPDVDLLHAVLGGTSLVWLLLVRNDPAGLPVRLAALARSGLDANPP